MCGLIYASGFSDDRNEQTINCPCAATPAHPLIREHYYSESGTTGDARLANIYFTGDPLWDGNGCISANNNCCADVSLPWFYRQFPSAQHEDIEAQLCVDEVASNEGVAVDQLQLLVQ